MTKYIVEGGNPLFGEVHISGAKNAAVAIIPAALMVDGVCRIENIPQISDVSLLLSILQDLGASIRTINRSTVEIDCTGIRNGQFLEEFMAQTFRQKQDVTLCYLDLEGVDDINNTYGDKVGDAYIQNFVEIVRKNFRSGDTFARLKDDKFCLALSGNVKHLIERKMAEILAIFQRDDDRIFCHRCNFKYSIIEVVGEENTSTLEELLSGAEAAIRRKKRTRSSSLDFVDW